LIAHYGDIKSNTFFSQLINSQQICPIRENIQQFQRWSIEVKKITEDNLLDLFMNTLKESTQYEVRLLEPKSLEHAFSVARKVESKNMAFIRVVIKNYREHHVPSPYLTQPIRLTPQQMDEIREKGLCFNCDSKYSKEHKCSERKLFYIDCEEEEYQEPEPSQDIELEETSPTISCHALVGFFTPQTLKIEGYIKIEKVTMLIDSGSTHNFIN
jgi:hypothetical protein